MCRSRRAAARRPGISKYIDNHSYDHGELVTYKDNGASAYEYRCTATHCAYMDKPSSSSWQRLGECKDGTAK